MSAFESPFPESARVALKTNLITQASVEIKFDVLSGLRFASPTDFRKKLSEEWPRYVEGGTTMQLPTIDGGTYEEIRPVHQFIGSEQKSLVKLTETSLSMSLRDYLNYEQFRGYWALILDHFTSSFEEVAVNRVGLRYLDVIKRSAVGLKDRPWDELMQPELIGLNSREFSGRVLGMFGQASLALGKDSWSATIRNGTLPVPPDNEECYSLDGDFVSEQRIDFRDTLPTCDELKRHAGRFFRWAVKPALLDVLGAREIPDFGSD